MKRPDILAVRAVPGYTFIGRAAMPVNRICPNDLSETFRPYRLSHNVTRGKLMTSAPPQRLKVLMVGQNVDGTDVGESLFAFKWAEEIAKRTDLTLLCLQRPGRMPVQQQLPGARVITWPEPAFLGRFERFRAMANPAWPLLCYHVRRWIAAAPGRGEHFDIAHQLMPSLRFGTPLRGQGIPYVVGPKGGSLSTPKAFRKELEPRPFFVRLRELDRLRLAYGPMLRASYADAALVIGSAPYIREALSNIPLQRYETILEAGAEPAFAPVEKSRRPGELKLVHVGRGVRTKGLRDVVRALAHLRDLPGVTLTSAGGGPEIDICREEAQRLGVADRVTFLGQLPRAEVEQLYAQGDVLAFPSFREPMGAVFFEAMRWGLPTITADRGGPQAIIDPSCGIMIPVTDPDRFARDIAAAIRTLATDPELTERLAAGARARLTKLGSWSDRGAQVEKLYRQIIAEKDRAAPARVA
jgi:glycosyltransferase involved in cell wall biosynthesis